ncbi:hypothetical protein I552_7790 [Mycobacterium xenopi 3993]|nr:hypothetical protein I552_7790 [Mycobacterium xenopi 3993]
MGGWSAVRPHAVISIDVAASTATMRTTNTSPCCHGEDPR